MVLGISTISWIESLKTSQLNDYFKFIDNLIVVVNSKDDEWVCDNRIFYRFGDYRELLDVVRYWSMCKAYPRKCLYSVNYSVVEITSGLTPELLERKWMRELENAGLLR